MASGAPEDVAASYGGLMAVPHAGPPHHHRVLSGGTSGTLAFFLPLLYVGWGSWKAGVGVGAGSSSTHVHVAVGPFYMMAPIWFCVVASSPLPPLHSCKVMWCAAKLSNLLCM